MDDSLGRRFTFAQARDDRHAPSEGYMGDLATWEKLTGKRLLWSTDEQPKPLEILDLLDESTYAPATQSRMLASLRQFHKWARHVSSGHSTEPRRFHRRPFGVTSGRRSATTRCGGFLSGRASRPNVESSFSVSSQQRGSRKPLTSLRFTCSRTGSAFQPRAKAEAAKPEWSRSSRLCTRSVS